MQSRVPCEVAASARACAGAAAAARAGGVDASRLENKFDVVLLLALSTT